jgi:hypothetical protein
VIDNVSSIPDWLSDALCKASTGDGWLRRRLYTDGDIAVLAFRRVVFMTSIDTGALRGDLGDRLVIIDLERIPDEKRIPETVLKARYSEQRPRILAGLLDMLVLVLKELETLPEKPLPRMADFGRVLMAMDSVLGTDSLGTFIRQRDRIANEVVEDDVIGPSVIALLDKTGLWSGTMKELKAAITPATPPKGWPKSARAMGGCLRRLTPALRRLGIEVTVPEPTDKHRKYVLERTAQTAQPPSGRGEKPDPAAPTPIAGAQTWAVGASSASDRPTDRPTQNPAPKPENSGFGRSGDQGGGIPTSSEITPDAACRVCGQAKWWRLAGETGRFTCGCCHPPTSDSEIEWFGDGGAEGDGP